MENIKGSNFLEELKPKFEIFLRIKSLPPLIVYYFASHITQIKKLFFKNVKVFNFQCALLHKLL